MYFNQDKYSEAKDILHWITNILLGLRAPGKTNYLDKENVIFYACLTSLDKGTQPFVVCDG